MASVNEWREVRGLQPLLRCDGRILLCLSPGNRCLLISERGLQLLLLSILRVLNGLERTIAGGSLNANRRVRCSLLLRRRLFRGLSRIEAAEQACRRRDAAYNRQCWNGATLRPLS